MRWKASEKIAQGPSGNSMQKNRSRAIFLLTCRRTAESGQMTPTRDLAAAVLLQYMYKSGSALIFLKMYTLEFWHSSPVHVCSERKLLCHSASLIFHGNGLSFICLLFYLWCLPLIYIAVYNLVLLGFFSSCCIEVCENETRSNLRFHAIIVKEKIIVDELIRCKNVRKNNQSLKA